MSTLRKIFDENTINTLRNNKHEITEDLLESLRAQGNEGKTIALEMLDLDKDQEQYYLDAFGNRMSFMGNRRIKKAYSKLLLSDIHSIEIEKCRNDIHYFKDNYVKIKTKTGVTFPDMREYQNDFIDILSDDDIDSVVSLQGRQSGKSITTSISLAHSFIFKVDINIGIVGNKGAQAREFLSNTKNILIELPIWLQVGIASWNKSSIEGENGMRILTDVPTSDAFRGFTIALLVVDECAFIRSSRWDEFADSIFPSQSALAWKKNVILSTANGLNHFSEIVEGAKKGTNGYKLFEVDWKDVPRYNSKGVKKTPEAFMKEIIDKHGMIYFNQNYANEFIGSSYTLISAMKLKSMTAVMPEEIRDGKLNIYHKPEKDHKYIMTVDAAKDGRDAFAVQVIDITNFQFKQAATAKLQIDYLLMPEFIFEWCEYYNNPYLIIENNEGAGQSIADQLYQTYEYENLHFDVKTDSNATNRSKSRKKYPGFRTTTRTRKQVLQTMKLFIENDKLEVIDKSTINEFFRFILINNKYQADDGAHDDMIMSLALAFAPFMSTKNFEDMKELVKGLYRDDASVDEEREKVGFVDMLVIGSFDDHTDDSLEEPGRKEYLTIEEAMADRDGFY